MENDDDLGTLRSGIVEMLKVNKEYAILDLIYHILIESARTPIDPPLSAQEAR